MYLMYVDETGDTGVGSSPTQYFGLSGLVVHETDWHQFIKDLANFKKRLRGIYGLPIREEIHAVEFVNHNRIAIPKYKRIAILRNTLDELAKLKYISITNVIMDKTARKSADEVFELTWKTLFQRFENTLLAGNFPGGHQGDFGIVFTDATAGTKLMRLVRKMGAFNPIPNNASFGGGVRNRPIVRIIEDPVGKDSSETIPIQMVDVCAYFLKQKLDPNTGIKKAGAANYFDRLAPVLNKHASTKDPHGIVRL